MQSNGPLQFTADLREPTVSLVKKYLKSPTNPKTHENINKKISKYSRSIGKIFLKNRERTQCKLTQLGQLKVIRRLPSDSDKND